MAAKIDDVKYQYKQTYLDGVDKFFFEANAKQYMMKTMFLLVYPEKCYPLNVVLSIWTTGFVCIHVECILEVQYYSLVAERQKALTVV